MSFLLSVARPSQALAQDTAFAQIVSIKCITEQEFTNDEIILERFIQPNGTTDQLPPLGDFPIDYFTFEDEGECFNLSPYLPKAFLESITLTLIEDDGNSGDDIIGTKVIESGDFAEGQIVTWNPNGSTAEYEVRYKVCRESDSCSNFIETTECTIPQGAH